MNGSLDLSNALTTQARRVSSARRTRGRIANLSGMLAEDNVARFMEHKGLTILERRWRGKAGEIDLIVREGQCLVFVEVKQSSTHEEAALKLGVIQQGRIMRAALEYCETFGLLLLPEMRFDAALVNRQGHIAILKRAFDETF